MKVFKIDYEMGNANYSAGILADDKDKALNFLRKVVKNIKSINSVGVSGSDIHGIDDAIINRILEKNKKPQTNENEAKITSLRAKLKDAQAQLGEYEEKFKAQEQELLNVRAELLTKRETIHEKVYLCDLCDFETKTKQGLKLHKSKIHKDEESK